SRGRLLRDSGDWEGAEAAFDAAARGGVSPTVWRAHVDAADAALRLHRNADAAAHLETALAQAPSEVLPRLAKALEQIRGR
ncbi:MAG TPA: tetratricopeptide repeat protein, partial [Opitutaceae bacterium]|nr:tetratricopeptide repeat protein [Opitutaceae bacterium]